MADLGLVLEVPQRGMDLITGQGGKAHRRNELCATIGQHAGDIGPALADETHQFARLVGGNATSHHQQDARVSHVVVPVPPVYWCLKQD